MFRKLKPAAIGCLVFLIAATQASAAFNEYSMLFDGVDEYVNCGNNNSLNPGTGNWSVSVWAKSSITADVWQALAQKTLTYTGTWGSGFAGSWGGGVIGSFFTILGTGISGGEKMYKTPLAYNDGNWHNFTWTWNFAAQELKLYVDNIYISSPIKVNDNEVSDLTNNDNLNLGRTPADVNYLNGGVDEVSVWNKALSSNEVSEIYNNGTPLNLLNHSAQTNLVSWWRMGDKASWDETDWTIPDQKGTNNGTSVNMEYVDRSTDAPGEYPPIPSGTTFMAR